MNSGQPEEVISAETVAQSYQGYGFNDIMSKWSFLLWIMPFAIYGYLWAGQRFKNNTAKGVTLLFMIFALGTVWVPIPHIGQNAVVSFALLLLVYSNKLIRPKVKAVATNMANMTNMTNMAYK